MTRQKRLVFLGNPIDDRTRAERAIVTDSPAATRKMLMMLKALRREGHWAIAYSMGRGRADGTVRSWGFKPTYARGVPVMYMPFSHRRIVSELLTLASAPALVWRLRKHAADTTLLLYNREIAYIPAAALARLLGFRVMLDFEDAEVIRTGRLRRFGAAIVDRLCRDGALLANEGLREWTGIRPARCYYGIVEPSQRPESSAGDMLRVLFGGTLTREWGTGLLADAIRLMKAGGEPWTARLRIDVTGQGEDMELLKALEEMPGSPAVHVHGRVSNAEYGRIVSEAQIGLQLRPRSGAVANTTFPSKVPEILGAGLLLMTTDISDVRHLVGDGAIYIDPDTPENLVQALQAMIEDRPAMESIRRRGQDTLQRHFDARQSARWLADFFGLASHA